MISNEIKAKVFADEQWLPIGGFEGLYEVSDLGNVRSIDRLLNNCSPLSKSKYKGKLLRPYPTTGGYVRVSLMAKCIKKAVLVHRLVGVHFIQNPNGYKEINHIDGNKLNNTASNLEWCTRSHNIKECMRLGLRKAPKNNPINGQFLKRSV